MNKQLTGTIIFWLSAAAPLAGIFVIHSIIDNGVFFFSAVLIYALLYRPLLNMGRLMSLNVIGKKDAWKLFIPFYQNRYMKEIWLRRVNNE